MHLSSKGEYGLLALVDLALHEGDPAVQGAQIAARQGIPKQYLDQLLIALKHAGLVASSRGRQGGYRLARPASTITLLEAISALEGPQRNGNFGGNAPRNSPQAALRTVWSELYAQVSGFLGSKTLQDLATECNEAGQVLTYEI